MSLESQVEAKSQAIRAEDADRRPWIDTVAVETILAADEETRRAYAGGPYYKLTDSRGFTRWGETGATHWAVGRVVRPTGVGEEPCGPGVLHMYYHPVVALVANLGHAHFSRDGLRMFEVRPPAEALVSSDGLKNWTTGPLYVVREMAVPYLTRVQVRALAKKTAERVSQLRKSRKDFRGRPWEEAFEYMLTRWVQEVGSSLAGLNQELNQDYAWPAWPVWLQNLAEAWSFLQEAHTTHSPGYWLKLSLESAHLAASK